MMKDGAILHLPLGIEQPYYQKAIERFPRNPVEGEPTAVGCAIVQGPAETVAAAETAEKAKTAMAAEAVKLLWSDDNWISVHQTDARCIGNADSVGNSGYSHTWLAVIPGAVSSTRICYKFLALTGDDTLESAEFSYTPAAKFICRLAGIRSAPAAAAADTDAVAGAADAAADADAAALARRIPAVELVYRSDAGEVEVSLGFFPEKHSGNSLLRRQLIINTSQTKKRAERDAGLQTNPRSLSFDRYTFTYDPERELVSITSRGTGSEEKSEDKSEDKSEKDSGHRDLQVFSQAGPIEVRAAGGSLASGDSREAVVQLTSLAQPEEKFFGFGERYNRIDQRGQILENVVYEQYCNQKLKTYMPVPFYFTSEGRGEYLADDHKITYDICASASGELRVTCETEIGRSSYAYLFIGKPAEILSSYASVTAQPVMPPAWVFSPWMSSNEWNTQERVLAEAQKSADLDIPAGVLVIEAWSDESTFYIWNGAEYPDRKPDEALSYEDFSFSRSAYWQDPKSMTDKLHAMGLKLVLWQIPIIKDAAADSLQQRKDWQHVIDRGYCVQEQNGEPYRVRPGWFHNGLLMDFTNPEASAWWFSRREYLLKEVGVDGFKTDGGEHLWGESTRFTSGRTGREMINSYPNSYIGAYHSYFQSLTDSPEQEFESGKVTFSRSGYRGVQAFPCHWAGDQASTWESYRGVIHAVLNAGLSGIPFVGWDIGGFSGPVPTSELYLRSAAAAAFSPVMQYHSEFNNHVEPHVDRTPWNIAERNGTPEVIDIYRMYAKLRQAMLPYILQEAAYCTRTGEPLMRPLLIDSPEDPAAWKIGDEYRFGRALLVAPILHEGEKGRKVYLPEGNWIDVWSGAPHAGPVWIEKQADLSIIPLFRDQDAAWPLDESFFSDAYRLAFL